MESDQEKVSTSELLLEDYLKRLGTVQSHLQARPSARLVTPESPLAAATAASGAVLSTVRRGGRCALLLFCLLLACLLVVLSRLLLKCFPLQPSQAGRNRIIAQQETPVSPFIKLA